VLKSGLKMCKYFGINGPIFMTVGSNPTLSAITLFPQDTRLLAGTIDENPRPKMWLERGQKEKPTSA
jgi:hypothetical protein